MSTTVIVLYEPTKHGRRALAEGERLARDRRARLRVLVSSHHERQNRGCAQCQANVAFWNRELETIAHEELDQARALLEDPADTEYRVINASNSRVLATLVASEGADLIVVPWRRSGSLSRRLGRGLIARLRAAGVREVRMAAPAGRGERAPRLGW